MFFRFENFALQSYKISGKCPQIAALKNVMMPLFCLTSVSISLFLENLTPGGARFPAFGV
jgi:hypothetical protein